MSSDEKAKDREAVKDIAEPVRAPRAATDGAGGRQARQAEALRANLRRRKTQARARRDDPNSPSKSEA